MTGARRYRIGEVYPTNAHGDIRVLDDCGGGKRVVVFMDTGYISICDTSKIKDGALKDKLKPIVEGVGFIGDGVYGQSDKFGVARYDCWTSMLRRCYSEEIHNQKPTYIGCSVCESWHNHQNFAKWYTDNYRKGYHIDKDLKVLGNRVYGPETCVFLPAFVNAFLTNNKKYNTTGYTGVTLTYPGKYRARTHHFGTNISLHIGYFNTAKEAGEAYITERGKQAKKAQEYLRSLGGYSEEIIMNIK